MTTSGTRVAVSAGCPPIRWRLTPNTSTATLTASHGPTVVYQSDFEGQENDFGGVPFPVVSDRDKGAGEVDGRNQTTTGRVRRHRGLGAGLCHPDFNLCLFCL